MSFCYAKITLENIQEIASILVYNLCCWFNDYTLNLNHRLFTAYNSNFSVSLIFVLTCYHIHKRKRRLRLFHLGKWIIRYYLITNVTDWRSSFKSKDYLLQRGNGYNYYDSRFLLVLLIYCILIVFLYCWYLLILFCPRAKRTTMVRR